MGACASCGKVGTEQVGEPMPRNMSPAPEPEQGEAALFRDFFRTHIIHVLEKKDRSPDVVRDKDDTDKLLECGSEQAVLEKYKNALHGVDKFELQNKAIGAKSASALAKVLHSMPALTHLNLSSNNLDEKDVMQKLAEPLKGMTALKELELRCNGLWRDGAMGELARSLRFMSVLTKLDLGDNQLFDSKGKGSKVLADVLSSMTSLTTLNLGGSMLDNKGATVLAGALSSMTALTALNLGGNSLENDAATELAGVLKNLSSLSQVYLGENNIGAEGCLKVLLSLLEVTSVTELSLDESPINVDWEDSNGRKMRPSEEVLAKGCWMETLHHLRVLQEPEYCREVRLVLAGFGEAGKTSLQKALRNSDQNRTNIIPKEQRTVGVDVFDWCPEEGNGLKIHVWDIAGQTIYQSVHSLFLSRRCIFLLVFQTVEGEGNEIFEKYVDPWLRLIHSRVPGAHVLLACTRFCTPREPGGDVALHQKQVKAVADTVNSSSKKLLKRLNKDTEVELSSLKHRLKGVKQQLKQQLEKLKTAPNQFSEVEREAPGGHGCGQMSRAKETEGTRHTTQKKVEDLRREKQEMESRLCLLRADRGSSDPLVMTLEGGQVHCIECVEGDDGKSVKDLRQMLVSCAEKMQCTKEQVPRQWFKLKEKIEEKIKRKEWKAVAIHRNSDEMKKLIDELPHLSEDNVWEALQFWNQLGYVLVHGDILLPQPREMIDFLRPIVHHEPLQALKGIQDESDQNGDEEPRYEGWVVDPSKFKKLGDNDQDEVTELVKKLQEGKLERELLKHLVRWCELDDNQIKMLLDVLEDLNLIVKHRTGSDTTEQPDSWLCACRLVECADDRGDSEIDWSRYDGETHARVGYSVDYLPPPLFPRFLAKLLSIFADEIEKKPVVTKTRVSMELLDDNRFTVKLEATKHEGLVEMRKIFLAANNVMILRRLCREFESMIGRDFVALRCRTRVEFDSQDSRWCWDVGKTEGKTESSNVEKKCTESLSQILCFKRWEKGVFGMSLSTPGNRRPFSVAKILGVPRADYFVSHSWAQNQILFRNLDKLVDRIEELTNRRVWFDKYELEDQQDFDDMIEVGLHDAQCVIICLSRSYLQSENCLKELKIAWELRNKEGKKMVLIAMEPEVQRPKINGWKSGEPLRFERTEEDDAQIHGDTVSWVKKHLMGIKINDYSELEDDEILKSALAQNQSQFPRDNRGEIEVGSDDMGWFIRDRQEPQAAPTENASCDQALQTPQPVAETSRRTTNPQSRRRHVLGFFPKADGDAANPYMEAQRLRNEVFTNVDEVCFDWHPLPNDKSFKDSMLSIKGGETVMHFAGHSQDGGLSFVRCRSGSARSMVLPEKNVVEITKRAVKKGLRYVVLNGCRTVLLGRQLCGEADVPYVVCWEDDVDDAWAEEFAVLFYKSFYKRNNWENFPEAFCEAKENLRVEKRSKFRNGDPLPRGRLCFLSSTVKDSIMPGDSEDDEDWDSSASAHAEDAAAENSDELEESSEDANDTEEGFTGFDGVDRDAVEGVTGHRAGVAREARGPVRSLTNEQGKHELKGFKALGFKLSFQRPDGTQVSVEWALEDYAKKDEERYPGDNLTKGLLKAYGLKRSKREMRSEPGKHHLFLTREAIRKVFHDKTLSTYKDVFEDRGPVQKKIEDLGKKDDKKSYDMLTTARKHFGEALKKRKKQRGDAVDRGDADKSHEDVLAALEKCVDRIEKILTDRKEKILPDRPDPVRLIWGGRNE